MNTIKKYCYKSNIAHFTFLLAGDILSMSNGSVFSTYDNDQDSSPTTNCAQTLGGGWWWDNCDATGALGALNANYSTRNQWFPASASGAFIVQTVEMKIRRACALFSC